MYTHDLVNKRIAILGFGQEGFSVAAYLKRNGLEAVIFDKTSLEDMDAQKVGLLSNLDWPGFFGIDYLHHLKGFDFIFRSPGIPSALPEIIEAKSNGSIITSQTDFIFKHAPCPIIGITGTKGKGTTTSLIYECLSLASKKGVVNGLLTPDSHVYITGNIGKTDALEILEKLAESDVVVYELSSFQLEDIYATPRIAVILMVTQDHLDHHANIEEYHEAKAHLIERMDKDGYAVINIDYPSAHFFQKKAAGSIVEVGRGSQVVHGAQILGDEIVIRGLDAQGVRDCIFTTEHALLVGKHNQENFAAAAVAALLAGVDTESIQEVIASFKGLEHRLEFVGEKEGVRFYNDSISTIPETSIVAANSFDAPLIMILGGSDKGLDFSSLGRAYGQKANLKAVILTGQTAPKIKTALLAGGVDAAKIYEGIEGMSSIFEVLKRLAIPGDVVVLSPACASYDQYKNYQDRGVQFKAKVLNYGTN